MIEDGLIKRVNILGIGVSAINMTQTIALVRGWIENKERIYITVSPTHTIMDCHENPELRGIVNRSALVTPDGMAVVWLLRGKGHKKVSRVYGPDLVQALCDVSQNTGWQHYFYGGQSGTCTQLVEELMKHYPALQVAGSFEPPYRAIEDSIEEKEIRQINESHADIVWIGLGSPKQEYWMSSNRERLKAPVLIGVGAAFDFLSGEKQQAPRWVQRSGFEWFYRLLQEPKRMWGRYKKYPLFCWLVLRQIWGFENYPLE